MATNKQNLSPENIDAWLASTGFLFPTNELELSRFDKLYEDVNFSVSEDDVSIERILAGTPRPIVVKMTFEVNRDEINQYRMVARNGNDLPDHILQKIKMNQDKAGRKDNDKPLNDG